MSFTADRKECAGLIKMNFNGAMTRDTTETRSGTLRIVCSRLRLDA